MTDPTAIGLAALGAAAALYQLAAVVTGKLPRITDLVRRMPSAAVAALIAAGTVWAIDHFLIDGGWF